MKPGDNIYFFIDRKIYGIGILKDINNECVFNNFLHSSAPVIINHSTITSQCLFDFGKDTPHHRWICLFEPSPFFFTKGIDMDDVLASNPTKFKMLRAFWKLSFLKIDDDENYAYVNSDIKIRKSDNSEVELNNINIMLKREGELYKLGYYAFNDLIGG